MTPECITIWRKLHDLDWHVYHIAEAHNGAWTARFWTDRECPEAGPLFDYDINRGGGGFSRRGEGRTLLAAMEDAAKDILKSQTEVVDLDAMLR